MKSPEQVREWLASASPGEELVYYRSYERRKSKDPTFTFVAEAEESGDVALFQRRCIYDDPTEDGPIPYFAYTARRLSARAAVLLDTLSKPAQPKELSHV